MTATIMFTEDENDRLIKGFPVETTSYRNALLIN